MTLSRTARFTLGFGLCTALSIAWGLEHPISGAAKDTDSFTSTFDVQPGDLSATGRNPYFVLEPGYQLTLEGGSERLVITVLDQTKVVDGVETRIVEERETNKNQLVEVSRNYYAISKRTNSVFYFGEDVDMYSNGTLSNHEGAWQSGVNGAKFGMMMPGDALLKSRFYQERAPKVAMDRAEIISLDEHLIAPAGAFETLKVLETSPLEMLAREYKYYTRGIGLVQDGSAKLVKYGKAER
jgi:hypothetical protein